jgi:hypothetical protein
MILSNAVTGLNGDTDAAIGKSQQISFSIFDEDNNAIPVKGLTNKIDMWIPRDSKATLDPFSLINATNSDDNVTQIINGFYLSYFDLNGMNNSINIQIKPINLTLGYLLFAKYGSVAAFSKNSKSFDLFKCFCPTG